MLVGLGKVIELLGFLIHRTLRSFHDKVTCHVWTFYPSGLASCDRPTV